MKSLITSRGCLETFIFVFNIALELLIEYRCFTLWKFTLLLGTKEAAPGTRDILLSCPFSPNFSLDVGDQSPLRLPSKLGETVDKLPTNVA